MGKVIVVSAQVDPRLKLQLVASEAIQSGEVIVPFTEHDIQIQRTWRTVQIEFNRHVRNDFLNFVDHSCEPNARLEIDARALVAIRDIAEKEPVTIFYPGSEVELAESFICNCGSPHCLGEIRGGFYLTHDQMKWALSRGYCTSFMQDQFRRLLGE